MSEPMQIKKYQKIEKMLSAALVSIATVAPIAFTYLFDRKMHGVLSVCVGLGVLLSAIWIIFYRGQVSKKIQNTYYSLDSGVHLISKEKKPRKFVITNSGYNHYHLKCVQSGEKTLISKKRIHEDFEISA